MELVMATAMAMARFLPFLEAAEEDALLAAANPQAFEPNQVVVDQDVPSRAI